MADATELPRRQGWTQRMRALCIFTMALAAGGAISCGDERPAPASTPGLSPIGGGSTQDAAAPDAACFYGEQRECHVTIGTNNGIVSCLDGTQTCGKETWGPCLGTVSAFPVATSSEEPALEGKDLPWVPPPPDGATPMSLSTAADCENNPCDPSCQVFDEDPDDPIAPEGTPVVVDYSQGDLNDPSTNVPGFVNMGLKDPAHNPTNPPCSSPADCQYDYHCDTVTGMCVPWAVGETMAGCAKPELTAGPACPGVVPLCNRGNEIAPAGIKIAVFNGNSVQLQGDLGKCDAGEITGGTLAGECVSQSTIDPGTCIDVACPAGLLSGTQSIMVNPPLPLGTTAPVDECHCSNNWTYYNNNAACEPYSCVATAESSAMQPVYMYILMDNSQSMANSGLWLPAKSGFRSFFQSPEAAGIEVALRFFGGGCDRYTCSIDACATPLVSLGPLTAATGTADPHETLLVDTLDNQSTGSNGTPIYPSVGGLAKWGVDHSVAHPGGQEVAVFVTDGDPNGCSTDWQQIRTLASDALAAEGVLTYVIGLYGSNQTDLNALAAAGGTGSAYFINSTDQTQVESGLLGALNAIRSNSMSCSIVLPNASTLDPNDVTFNYVSGTGESKTTVRKSGEAACTGQDYEWYLDSNTSPTLAILCPTFCATAQGDAGASIEVLAGCPKVYAPIDFSHVYEGVCPPGTMAQWQYMSYDTVTPSDSNVVFEARTALSAAALGPPDTLLATASASPDTQVCPMSGPAPCPVNLYDKLGTANAFAPFLEVIATLNPSSDKLAGPTVHGWEITYSCPPTE